MIIQKKSQACHPIQNLDQSAKNVKVILPLALRKMSVIAADKPLTVLTAAAPSVLEAPLEITSCALDAPPPRYTGFTICGDNLDNNVKRRHQQCDRKTVSLHYFNLTL